MWLMVSTKGALSGAVQSGVTGSGPGWKVRASRDQALSISVRNRSASMAAMQPLPAAVTAWR